mmetsp:Transcript_99436/g.278462  ORF Transcript_99436/g.278462 Transcript_99436/m.278462 type:complete len:271 (+) Transcript_99436:58-870(+)
MPRMRDVQLAGPRPLIHVLDVGALQADCSCRVASLPPLVSLVGAGAGPRSCVALGRSCRAWRRLVPTSLPAEDLPEWAAHYWGSAPSAANVSETFLLGDRSLFDGGVLGAPPPSAAVSFASPTNSPTRPTTVERFRWEELDRVFVALVLAPEVLVSCDSKGLSLLHRAARQRRYAIVSLLVHLRAPVDAASRVDGRTPLHCAAASGDGKCVKALLQARANPVVRDMHGKLPLEMSLRIRSEAQGALLKAMRQGGGVSRCSSRRRRECSVL